jgi:hypothetical protein
MRQWYAVLQYGPEGKPGGFKTCTLVVQSTVVSTNRASTIYETPLNFPKQLYFCGWVLLPFTTVIS